jgi:hypothetical protein
LLNAGAVALANASDAATTNIRFGTPGISVDVGTV